ncbi:V-type ATP synthase subunit E [Novisyntrophococcus fermenticellae]|uniref:V-type ATP synthase subunit E n=1 Tax=Novisyntrophococcus fermenticellae TaxID=2068655 RepID=UPI001E421735|nr:V-type ATP synthase subunit E [Novisyntrophococcus fermenticellae]
MTIEEKLQNFYNSSIDSAQAEARAMIEEHEAALEKIFTEHKETAERQAEAELKAEKEKLKRNLNKKLSTEQLHIKRSLTKKNMELKNKLFAEVDEKISVFMKTPEYEAYLERKITETLAFAGDDSMEIYINPSDAHLKEQLERSSKTTLIISKEDFKGGIRAVIPEKHILIDNSLLTLLNEEKEAFIFHGGAAHE